MVHISQFVALLVAVILCSAETLNAAAVQSPNGRIKASVVEENGQLYLSADLHDEALLKASPIGFTFNLDGVFIPKWTVQSSTVEAIDETWHPVFGKRSLVHNECNELTVRVVSNHASELAVDVVVRAYDDGVAIRQVVGTNAAGVALKWLKVVKNLMSLDFAEPLTWWSYQREREPKNQGANRLYPLYSETIMGKSIVVTEGYLRDMAAMDVIEKAGKLEIAGGEGFAFSTFPYAMPWRVILIGDTAGQLLDSDLIVNLNPKADPKDYEWLKAGIALWDWRAFGHKTNDGFVYGQNKASWLRYIDFAAEQGIPYVMIDANWYGPERDPKSDPINGGQAETIRELIKYGNQRDVGLILYLNHKGAEGFGIANVMANYQSWGAKGIKYGFMKAGGAMKTRLTHEISKMAGERELTINFHDGPLPPTGEEAYMPSLANREFCHAQSDAGRTFDPTGFLRMTHVNMMAGPLDMTHGMFDLNDGMRERSKVRAQINATLTSVAARTLITYSGAWNVITDSPDSYREHLDLFQFISAQKMPWTESKTLKSRFDQYISMMRQSGDTYLVGTVTNEDARELEIDFSFLPKGKQFKARIFADTAETHYVKNRLAYSVSEMTVDADTKILAKLAPGGGHCMIIEPVD